MKLIENYLSNLRNITLNEDKMKMLDISTKNQDFYIIKNEEFLNSIYVEDSERNILETLNFNFSIVI